MIRPKNFGYNPQTQESNAFQKKLDHLSDKNISQIAINEFNTYVKLLREKNIDVNVVEDTDNPPKPDAVFPNNWISFEGNGSVTLFPMESQLRRSEVRVDIIDSLKEKFEVGEIIDMRNEAQSEQFLEGTGSMVIDHRFGTVYACISSRTNKELLDEFARKNDYRLVKFYSKDIKGNDIYHTNVMMNIGQSFAMICSESIVDDSERKTVIDSLNNTGREIIEFSYDQMNNFAGNMLELSNDKGKLFLVMSQSALRALDDNQISALRKHTELLPVNIDTIESVGGGSARCMIAEIFLKRK